MPDKPLPSTLPVPLRDMHCSPAGHVLLPYRAYVHFLFFSYVSLRSPTARRTRTKHPRITTAATRLIASTYLTLCPITP